MAYSYCLYLQNYYYFCSNIKFRLFIFLFRLNLTFAHNSVLLMLFVSIIIIIRFKTNLPNLIKIASFVDCNKINLVNVTNIIVIVKIHSYF